MGMETALFTAEHASPEELRAWYELFVDASDEDSPGSPVDPYDTYAETLRITETSRWARLRWQTREAGRLLGTATATFPTGENSTFCDIEVHVVAEERGRGVGTALLRAALPLIRDRGCRTIAGHVKVGTHGEKWAAALGFRDVLRLTAHHLDIPGTDPARWQLETPPGFQLRQWADAVPDDLIEGFVQARNTMADQPLGDASWQYPTWTVERIRGLEADWLKVGRVRRYVAAVEEHSGTVAGFTEIALDDDRGTTCRQGDTGVLPQFRGRGLGLAMKASMMRWLTADLPQLEQVHTVTASENAHMIGVNTRLGYRSDHAFASVESDVSSLEAVLAR